MFEDYARALVDLGKENNRLLARLAQDLDTSQRSLATEGPAGPYSPFGKRLWYWDRYAHFIADNMGASVPRVIPFENRDTYLAISALRVSIQSAGIVTLHWQPFGAAAVAPFTTGAGPYNAVLRNVFFAANLSSINAGGPNTVFEAYMPGAVIIPPNSSIYLCNTNGGVYNIVGIYYSEGVIASGGSA